MRAGSGSPACDLRCEDGLASAPDPRDRWLLMRLLAIGQSTPRLADRLLAERGTLGGVLALSDERLRQMGTDPNGITILGLLREAIASVLEPRHFPRPRVDSPETVVRMLFGAMAWRSTEEARAVFLDPRQRLLRVETVGLGGPLWASVQPREIARRALELSAAAVVLVHNHPSGDPTPSSEDVEITHRLRAALATLDIALLDHLVLASGGWASAAALESSVRPPPLAKGEGISRVRISTVRT
ncbi:MAG: hypothetical protein NZM40_02770 [Sphingomonadaceae bacterium]|uniref:JAB domain-containing protein n=1 Tax=Thermaurantiacus sp. TaxID=2820283 RepID=UPI00298EDACE|nr:JAB domain-containing protein [Thermaurantiacus sp.]MCS6986348.1 hypothetical protein [Sphingomonadaceae bacterium]MDW8414390.1 JAB domain-containing protein [Thermaurantiacus sp.]